MAAHKHEIPEEFASELTFIPSKDERTDDEILESFDKYVPVTSEKNIWAFWDSGVRQMKGWCKRNVIQWARICGPEWTIRVCNIVPGSPNHVFQYLDKSLFPDVMVNGSIEGEWLGAHSSDFYCGAALCQYGGVYMDVGAILIRHMDDLCWNKLSDPESPYTFCVPWICDTAIINAFVAARRADPFIVRWHKLFLKLWEGRHHADGIAESPLVQFYFSSGIIEKAAERGLTWTYKEGLDPIRLGSYIGQTLSWSRMASTPNCGDSEGFNASQYWQDHALLFGIDTDLFMFEATYNWDVQEKCFNMLRSPLNDNSPIAVEAYHFIWKLLRGGSIQKVCHGKNLMVYSSLGDLLDAHDNEMVDATDGTFGELLRYGCVHFHQSRPVMYHKGPRAEYLVKEDEGLYGGLEPPSIPFLDALEPSKPKP